MGCTSRPRLGRGVLLDQGLGRDGLLEDLIVAVSVLLMLLRRSEARRV